MSMLLVLLLLCLRLRVHALTLTLPSDKFTAGTSVTVQWSRTSADPVSFGLMQRSLQGNEGILSVTPVQNSGEASSGSVAVVFDIDTVGQVILSGISQLSLSSGESPNQLEAGKQLTILPSSGSGTTTPPPPSQPPDDTSSPQPPKNTLTPTTLTTVTRTTRTSTTTAQEETNTVPASPPDGTTSAVTDPTCVAFFSVIPYGQHPDFHSSDPPASSASTSIPASSPLANNNTSGTSKPRSNNGLIALAVILSLLIVSLVALILLRCVFRRRRETQRANRISRFYGTGTGSSRGTIASFGFGQTGTRTGSSGTGTMKYYLDVDLEAAGAIDLDPGVAGLGVSTTIPRERGPEKMLSRGSPPPGYEHGVSVGTSAIAGGDSVAVAGEKQRRRPT
ncbi:hypothetical protein C8F01DRAFT_1130150 [Mycena amicta]|nr:hypothetical protein C8F01DRAFT_1130150 [Mycena amicta]